MKHLYLILILCFTVVLHAQDRILVFHKTNGFRHSGAINNGITMFEDLGNATNDWITDNSQDSSVFNASNLAQYDAVVFLNTSGNNLLSASEQEAFEAFIASGKGFIGIHAATDTYRNGNWDFYNELVGGIVQTSPNHTSNNFNADIEVITSNPIIDFLGPVGSIWNKDEEYYYWQNNGGQLSTDNTVLLEVEQTGSNSYDAARPITWFKESVTYDDDNDDNTPKVSMSGIRSFYTALGHNGGDYSGNTNFRTMLKNATEWAIGNTLSLEDDVISNFKITPNPVHRVATIHFGNITAPVDLKLYDVLGKQMLRATIHPRDLSQGSFSLDLSNFKNGLYIAQCHTSTRTKSFKLIKS